MLTKNLSKADYYKSRNIAIPKPLHKLAPQPPVRLHLLEPLPSLAIQIKRHIQTKKYKQARQLQHLGYEPNFHQAQIKVQDLTKCLANRQDEITSLRNDKQKDERRITFLDKENFDLKTQLQKVEYEYKSTIEFLKVQNINQKNEYQQRMIFLQEESTKAKQDYSNLLKNTKDTYDLRIQSFFGTKETLKFASEQMMNGLKKDIQFHISENKRLRNELILSEKEVMERLKYYEEENYLLKQKLQQQQLQYSLSVIKTNTQVESRNSRIKQLNDQIQEIVKTFQTERQKLLFEKQYMERAKNDRQKSFKQKIDSLLSQKQKHEKQSRNYFNQYNELKNANFQFEKKINEISTKLSFIEFEKQENLYKLKQEFQEIKHNQKIQFNNQIQLLKQSYQHKIINYQNNLELKNNQIFQFKQKIHNLQQEIQDKLIFIKNLQEKQKITKHQINSINQIYQTSCKELKNIKKQIDIIRIQHENQKQELLNRIHQQKSVEFQKFTNESKQITVNLKKEIDEIKLSNETELKKLISQNEKIQNVVSNLTQQNNTLKRQKQCLQTKFDSLNLHYEQEQTKHKQYIAELQQLISQGADALKKNSQSIQQFKIQYNKLKQEIILKQSFIDKLQKQLKQSRIDHDQIKLKSIKKNVQFQEKMQQNFNKIEEQKHELVIKLKKTQNQVTNLEVKLENLTLTATNLQSQKQVYQNENRRLKQAYAKKEQNSNNLLNQINIERKQLAQKISIDFKQKIIKLQQKNQTYIQELSQIQQKNIQLLQTVHKNETIFIQLEKKLEQKNIQFVLASQQIQIGKNHISKLQEHITQLNSIVLTIENEKRVLDNDKQILHQRISEYQNNVADMKRSNLYDNDFVQELRSRLNRLLLIIQEQKMDLEFQKTQRQNLDILLEQCRQQLNDKNSQIGDLQESLKNHRILFEKQITQVKMKEVRQQFQSKNRELYEKICSIEQKINQKDTQLTTIKQILTEKQQTIQKYQEIQLQLKKKTDLLAKTKARSDEFQEGFKKCIDQLGKKQGMLRALTFEYKKLEINKNVDITQKEMKCTKIQNSLNAMTQKLEALKNKGFQVQKNYSLQIIKLKQDSVKQDELIEKLKNQINELQKHKEQIRADLAKQYEESFLRFRVDRQEQLNNLYIENQRNLQLLRNQITQLNQQKQRYKNQLLTLKEKSESEIARKNQQHIFSQQTIKRLTRINEFLFGYKQRWEKICGEVKEYDNLDPVEAQQVDRSFSTSMKASIIIDQPFISKLEKDRLFAEQKLFFQTPQTGYKEETQKKQKKYRYDEFEKTQRSEKSQKSVNSIKKQQ